MEDDIVNDTVATQAVALLTELLADTLIGEQPATDMPHAYRCVYCKAVIVWRHDHRESCPVYRGRKLLALIEAEPWRIGR